MNTHLMLDYETLGHIAPNICTLSLGAVIFNQDEIIKKEYWVFCLDEQIKLGRVISADTLSWWLRQEKAAQDVLDDAYRSKFPEELIMQQLQSLVGLANKKNIKVWSAGAGFDVPIAEHQLRTHNLEVPWMFWNVRCYRTLKYMFDIEANVPREGVKHNALDDAIYQATCVQRHLKAYPRQDI